jgi:hypothetical protein
MREFIHPVLGEPVAAVGGHYVFTTEVRMPFRGRELLYHVGYAVVDTACCGAGGAVFASVAGFVGAWHSARSADGAPVSRVLPVEDGALQVEIRRMVKARERVHQVNFIDA